MPFQSSVRIDQTTGVVGDIIIDGPMRGVPAILSSTLAANNVIGRAFRHVADDDMKVTADDATNMNFAGILANSKVYANDGTLTGGTLAPTLTLANDVQVELVTMTSGIVVSLSTSADIGDNVFYADATGILAASDQDTLTDHTIIPRARVVRRNISAAGLAIIELT